MSPTPSSTPTRPRRSPAWRPRADIGRQRPQFFHRYRSSAVQGSAEATCVVTPVFDVDGTERQRLAADTLLDGPLSEPVPGLRAMHFHLSTDGVHVLNYAEWTSADAHHAYLASGVSERARAALQRLGGVRGLGGQRYVLHHQITAPAC